MLFYGGYGGLVVTSLIGTLLPLFSYGVSSLRETLRLKVKEHL